jgi:NADH-quinone oxidoreductase subunit K
MVYFLEYVFCCTNTLFVLSWFGLCYNSRNLLRYLFCLELLFAGISLNFIYVSSYLGIFVGQVYGVVILALAAAEAVTGVSLLVSWHYVAK